MVITSLACKYALRNPAIRLHSAPPSAPATKHKARCGSVGSPVTLSATHTEKIAPRIIWPSAPMFQYWQRNEIDTETAISSSGVALTNVSVKRSVVPKAPYSRLS